MKNDSCCPICGMFCEPMSLVAGSGREIHRCAPSVLRAIDGAHLAADDTGIELQHTRRERLRDGFHAEDKE